MSKSDRAREICICRSIGAGKLIDDWQFRNGMLKVNWPGDVAMIRLRKRGARSSQYPMCITQSESCIDKAQATAPILFLCLGPPFSPFPAAERKDRAPDLACIYNLASRPLRPKCKGARSASELSVSKRNAVSIAGSISTSQAK